MRCVLFIAALSLASRGALAQSATGLGKIIVTLRDSAGRGDSLTRGSVCARVVEYTRCAPVDHGRRFVIDSIPPGLAAVSVGCPSVRPRLFGRREAAYAVVRVSDSIPVEQTLNASLGECDTRPFRRVTGIMVGHYSSALEHSGIAPCAPDGWFQPSDSLRRTWAQVGTKQRVRWPKPGHPDYIDEAGKKHKNEGYSYYFVRARGTLEGPGSYGHMGAAQFQFTIDSVLEVRTPRDNDCR